MNSVLLDIVESLDNVKNSKPLVHCITNYVTARDCANVVLSVGALATMAEEIEEVEEVTAASQALVINLGTITSNKVKSMIKAGKVANKNNIPVVLDPVGVASTSFRKNVAHRILSEVKVGVIRGNMAEIKALLGLRINSKGVDSRENESVNTSKEIAKSLAKKLDTVVAITGKRDYISDGNYVIGIDNGSELLTKITGAGCMTSALIGAFVGGNKSRFISTISAILVMGICGELAKESLKDEEGIGTFFIKLMDSIYSINKEIILERGKIYE